MVYRPDTVDAIQSNLTGRLKGKIDKLTNFVTGSFNDLWTNAFSKQLRENQEALLASQLSGWIEYAGGPVTEDDLSSLGIDSVKAEDVNEYMHDNDLDELVRIVGTERDPGDKASGEVEVTVSNDSVTIPEGTEFGTDPDTDGTYLSYFTTSRVQTPDNQTSVLVNVVADEVGEEYNVGSGQITYLPNPPNGVEGVINETSITGGVNRESNEDLRVRAKNSVLEHSGGGTVDGIEGYIRNNVDGVITVRVEEFSNSSPPYGDVIVDGGDDPDVLDAIDQSHPSGVLHNLVRPTRYTIDVYAEVEGSNVTTDSAERLVASYIDGLELGENMYRDKVIQKIMNADVDIDNIVTLDIEIVNDPYTFVSGTNVYQLDKDVSDDGIVEVTGVSGGSSTTFIEDTDYQEWNSTTGSTATPHDSIDWSLAGSDPDGGTEFYVDYTAPNDVSVQPREKAEPGAISINLV